MQKDAKIPSSSRNPRKRLLSTALERDDLQNTSSDRDDGSLNRQGGRRTRLRGNAQPNGDTDFLGHRFGFAPRGITPHASTSRSASPFLPAGLLLPNLTNSQNDPDLQNNGSYNVSYKVMHLENPPFFLLYFDTKVSSQNQHLGNLPSADGTPLPPRQHASSSNSLLEDEGKVHDDKPHSDGTRPFVSPFTAQMAKRALRRGRKPEPSNITQTLVPRDNECDMIHAPTSQRSDAVGMANSIAIEPEILDDRPCPSCCFLIINVFGRSLFITPWL